MKIVFNITEQGAWAEIEQADGTMKKWDEDLTADEYAQICAAGMMMQRGTMIMAILDDPFSKNKNPRRLEKIEQHLDKAETLVKKIFGIE